MRFLFALPILAAMGGCAQFDAAVADLNTPATQQALTTVRTGFNTLACVVASTQNKKTVLYAVSVDACLATGGTVAAR